MIALRQDDASAHERCFSEAVAYVIFVEATFRDNRETFEAFLNILKDYRENRLDVASVFERIDSLFSCHSSHRELVLGFSLFLPEGYIIIEEDQGYIIIEEDIKEEEVDIISTTMDDCQ